MAVAAITAISSAPTVPPGLTLSAKNADSAPSKSSHRVNRCSGRVRCGEIASTTTALCTTRTAGRFLPLNSPPMTALSSGQLPDAIRDTTKASATASTSEASAWPSTIRLRRASAVMTRITAHRLSRSKKNAHTGSRNDGALLRNVPSGVDASPTGNAITIAASAITDGTSSSTSDARRDRGCPGEEE